MPIHRQPAHLLPFVLRLLYFALGLFFGVLLTTLYALSTSPIAHSANSGDAQPQSSANPLSSADLATSPAASFTLSAIDAETGQPVIANVSVRREDLAGNLIGDEDGDYYPAVQTLSLPLPVDPNSRTYVLVEAQGYQDWELGFRIKKPGNIAGPVRLQPLP